MDVAAVVKGHPTLISAIIPRLFLQATEYCSASQFQAFVFMCLMEIQLEASTNFIDVQVKTLNCRLYSLHTSQERQRQHIRKIEIEALNLSEILVEGKQQSIED